MDGAPGVLKAIAWIAFLPVIVNTIKNKLRDALTDALCPNVEGQSPGDCKTKDTNPLLIALPDHPVGEAATRVPRKLVLADCGLHSGRKVQRLAGWLEISGSRAERTNPRRNGDRQEKAPDLRQGVVWKFFVVTLVVGNKSKDVSVHAPIVCVIRVARPDLFIVPTTTEPARIEKFGSNRSFARSGRSFFARNSGPHLGGGLSS